jgi:hypothetical protein
MVQRLTTTAMVAVVTLSMAGASALAADRVSPSVQSGSQAQAQNPQNPQTQPDPQAPQNPPTQQNPPTGQEPQTQTQSQGQQSRQPDEAAARAALAQAKQSLTELIALPDTSKLSADARSAINQVITNFNSLVTAESNWYERYRDVQRSLAPMIGPDPAEGAAGATGTSGTGTTGAAGTTGTSGTAAGATTATGAAGGASVDVPAPVKDKLVQFRQHMSEFAQAAGAPPPGSPAATAAEAAARAKSGASPNGAEMQTEIDAIVDLIQQALGSQASSSGSSSTGTSGTGTSGTGTSGTSASGAASSGTVTVDRPTRLLNSEF